MTALGLALGVWLVVSAKLDLLARIRFFDGPWASLVRLRHLPRAVLGMTMAHMGLGFMVLAITISESFTTETLAVLTPGEGADVGRYRFTLERVDPVAGPNYAAVRAVVTVHRDARLVATLAPEDRVYADPVMNTTEAGIAPLVIGDLYAVIGEAVGPVAEAGRWSMRFYFKPAISGLWLGAALMMVGGLLSLGDRRVRVGAAAARRADAMGGEKNGEGAA